jgi:predicted solute-binding protein
MDSSEIFAYAVAAVVINALILYVVINAATKATRRAKYEGATQELLGRIAKQLGVPEEDVKRTFDKFK